MGSPGGSAGKESACNTRDQDLSPGSGRSPGEGKRYPLQYFYLKKRAVDNSPWASQVALVVKNPPASAGAVRRRFDLRHRSGRSPGGGHGNPLGIFAWRIPRTEQPGGLQSMGSQRIGHDCSALAHTQQSMGHKRGRHN